MKNKLPKKQKQGFKNDRSSDFGIEQHSPLYLLKGIQTENDINTFTIQPEYNFLSPSRLFNTNNVTSDKVNFRLDIRQKFCRKIRTSKVCVALKRI